MASFATPIASLAIVVIRTTFPPRELARPLGMYTAVFGLGQLVGPLLTPVFQQNLTWRVAFVLPILCGTAGGVLVWR